MRLTPATWIIVLGLATLVGPAEAQQRVYDTRYYVLRTDIDPDAIREVDARITAMAEAYYERTKGFAGTINRKFDFLLFKDPRDYYAAGGLPGSAGVFDGSKLMAIAGKELTAGVWHVIQHEGFHQFVREVVGGDIPIWVNEGMAEYFGESIYTGDGYVVGVVTAQRLARLQHWIREGNTASVAKMMTLHHETWNIQMSIVNYDQAWSMIYFLAHGDNGRYQKALNSFIRGVSHGASWDQAWVQNFGTGTKDFESRWRDYWLSMPPEGTIGKQAEAATATITSFYARAFSQRQIFKNWDAFVAAANDGKLSSHNEDWLPPSLLEHALAAADKLGEWSVETRPGKYEIACDLGDQGRYVGSFQVTTNRRIKPGSVAVRYEPKKSRR